MRFTSVIGLAIAMVVGCSSSDNNSSSNMGTLEQSWTIAGTTSPTLCSANNAAQVRLVVLDPGLVVTATQFAPCNAFRLTVQLPDNTYTGNLTFLNDGGGTVSSSRQITQFVVRAGQTTSQTIDVPATAFILH
jgi:hypothetical protein